MLSRQGRLFVAVAATVAPVLAMAAEDSSPTRADEPFYIYLVTGALLATAVTALAVFLWTWSLRRMVARRTREMQEGQERFSAVFDSSPVPILLKDLEERYILVNSAFEALMGTSRGELLGKTAADFHASDKPYIAEIHAMEREVIETACMAQRETYVRMPDGRQVSTLITKFPILGKNGEVTSVGTIDMDITERRRAEKAVEASQARLNAILEIAPEAVIAVGCDMNVQVFNQGAARIFGYTSDEVVGQKLDVLIPERFHAGHRELVKTFDESKSSYRLMDQRQEIQGRRKNGDEFPAMASVSRLEIGGEKIFIVMLRDNTDRRRRDADRRDALADAEKANRAKSDFLAAMSHELRTPLNAILGFADILSCELMGPIGQRRYREYAGDIHTSGKQLLSLVDDLLDISTIEAGKTKITIEPLPVDVVVTDCIHAVAGQAALKNIELTVDTPANSPPFYADRRAIRQILLNLLSNSLKFTPEGGRVTLSAAVSDCETVFTVADTGIGIPADRLPDLMEPFVRAEPNPHKPVEGWGLGLSIVKSLVELHAGQIEIQSEIGTGCTVTVTLPVSAQKSFV